MAKHYKKYNADNKNKSQNIIKKHLCLHGITRPQVAFLNYNMFAANHHDKIAPPPTPLRAHKKILLRIRDPCRPRCRRDTRHAPHHHRQAPQRPPPRTRRHPIHQKSARPPPPHHTKTKPPTTTTHHHSPTPHTQRQKKTPKRPSHTKKAQKNGGNPPLFNNKTPIAPTFAPCFWLFLQDYLQFLKFSSNVHRPVLRYFLYLFPVHFHYSGRPLSVLFLNNN